jgi:hypothetical protein
MMLSKPLPSKIQEDSGVSGDSKKLLFKLQRSINRISKKTILSRARLLEMLPMHLDPLQTPLVAPQALLEGEIFPLISSESNSNGQAQEDSLIQDNV